MGTTLSGKTSGLVTQAIVLIYLMYHRHVMSGKKEWEPFIHQMFSRPEFELDWEPARVEVRPSDDIGYTAGNWRATWKDADGKPTELSGSYLAVWERQEDGEWKVFAETEDAGKSMFQLREIRPE
jgi:ketosteroid isomerase-like protein